MAVISKEMVAGSMKWMGTLREWMFAENLAGNSGEHQTATDEPHRGNKRGLRRESKGL